MYLKKSKYYYIILIFYINHCIITMQNRKYEQKKQINKSVQLKQLK